MSEWRDFLEGAQLTDAQYKIIGILDDFINSETIPTSKEVEHLRDLVVREFTGARIV